MERETMVANDNNNNSMRESFCDLGFILSIFGVWLLAACFAERK